MPSETSAKLGNGVKTRPDEPTAQVVAMAAVDKKSRRLSAQAVRDLSERFPMDVGANAEVAVGMNSMANAIKEHKEFMSAN